jgi:WD40 repeat protein
MHKAVFLILPLLYTSTLSPVSLNGTTGIIHKSHYLFTEKTNNIIGFVRLDNGFTVVPQPGPTGTSSTLTFSGCTSVAGAIDLRETSTLVLASSITFDSSVTLSSGGHIYGNNNAIILQGNLTIPANKVIHFGSGGSYATGPGGGTAIRGNGNTITIDNWAQLFIDTNTTLTISNATIKFTKGRNAGMPPIKLAALNSKLALDNVTLDLTTGGDFYFTQGQLYIHNDVMVTGTSAFIHTSPAPSWITSGGTFYFDQGTTFSIAPATFTDAPYTLKNTYTDCNFIKMVDKTSTMYLNGCSLIATDTGIRLTKGSILCDNAVSFDSIETTSVHKFSSTTYSSVIDYGNELQSLSWHPNGSLIAAGGNTSNINIYLFTGSAINDVTSVVYSGSVSVKTVIWSPDGRYLAVGGESSIGVKIYQFTGSALNLVATAAYSNAVESISWSPDGRYVVAGGSSNNVTVYQFNGTGLTQVATTAAGSTIFSTSWSSDGRYIAVGLNGGTAVVYQFTGSALNSVASANYTTAVITTAWSPDGRYLAIGGYATNPTTKIYRFTGSALSSVANTTAFYSGLTYIQSISWSPDGTYFAVVGNSPYTIKIYQFTGSSLSNGGNPIAVSSAYSGAVYFVEWNRNNYLAIAGPGASPERKVKVYPLLLAKPIAPQAISKSIVFGDSTKGNSYDSQVILTGGANVTINGKVYFDNAEG